MSYIVTPIRIAIFLTCITFFWYLGGFTPLDTELGGELIHRKSQKAWLYCIIAFLAGAVSVNFIEHKVGLMDPINLRFAYILGGIALMLLGILWNHSLVQGLTAQMTNR